MIAHGVLRFVAKPVLKTIGSGTSLCEFTLVDNERRKVGDKIVETAHFFDFVIWDKAADVVAKHFDKGDLIEIVSATVRQEKWEKDGQKRSKIVFRVNDFKFVSNKAKSTETTEHVDEPTPTTEESPF